MTDIEDNKRGHLTDPTQGSRIPERANDFGVDNKLTKKKKNSKILILKIVIIHPNQNTNTKTKIYSNSIFG